MKAERMYNMLYKDNNGLTINLDSIIAIIENNNSRYDLTIMLNDGYTTSLYFNTSLDKVLFLKALRTNTVSEFYKFENPDSELMICNPAELLHPDSLHFNSSLFEKINGNFIINILSIDFYKYIDFDNRLNIRTGDTEFILNNISKEEYDKFDNFMINHFGLVEKNDER